MNPIVIIKKLCFFILIGGLLLNINGCGKLKELGLNIPNQDDIKSSESALTSEQNKQISAATAAGDSALKSGQLSSAITQYEAVLAINPYDPTANLVLSMCEFIKMVSDPATIEIVNNYEKKTGNKLPLPASITAMSNQSATIKTTGIFTKESFDYSEYMNQLMLGFINGIPTMNAMRDTEVDFIERVLIPTMQISKNHLDIVLARETFSYTLKTNITRLDHDVIIDKSECYLLRSLISLFEGMSHETVVYNTQLNPSMTTANFTDVVSFLDANPNYMTIRSNGADHMKQALACYASMIDSTKSAFVYIQNATGNIQLKYNLSLQQIDSTITVLDKTKTYLEGTPVQLCISNADISSTPITLNVNIAAYYNNPITDIREYVNHDVVIGKDLSTSKFPNNFDFTIHGLFPDLKDTTQWQKVIPYIWLGRIRFATQANHY